MPLTRLVCAGALGAQLGLCLVTAAPAAAAPAAARRLAVPGEDSAVLRVYAPAVGDVPNPERGFYRQFTPFWLGTQRLPLDERTLNAVRAEGLSVVRAYFVIDEFLGAPLSPAALDEIGAAFFAVRRAGLKIIPRFAYNFPTSADFQRAQDAPLERVLQHIDQLTPVLIANADVIAFMEAGFVGAWGEWHSSASGLLEPDHSLNSRSEAILARLLAALPRTRMVALRYPFHKQQLFGLSPIDPRSAFDGPPRARVGAHNDCFAAGPTNGGTYSPPPRLAQSIEALKTFLGLDNRFVPQGGESCGPDADGAAFPQPEVRCASALADLARMRWSTLNIAYHPAVLALWQQEGCYPEIRRRLGYRFRLVDADMRLRATPGRPWSLTLRVTNDGWAAPYNPRLVELVLRHVATGQLSRFPLDTDPRFWGPGETHVVRVAFRVPDELVEGDYDLLLHLPDPERGLYGDPAYSIQLANAGVWEPATGFNSLQTRVTVVAPARERRGDCVGRAERQRGSRECIGR